ncbi:MAG: hypothetical protein KAR06_00510, partial [Deltaproteobacteria bacterium]|nr:hypothetical protein [Deltaproteobacteria bacterium]
MTFSITPKDELTISNSKTKKRAGEVIIMIFFILPPDEIITSNSEIKKRAGEKKLRPIYYTLYKVRTVAKTAYIMPPMP